MPPALLPREAVVDRLMLVLRRQGYAGASVADLCEATGLGKSSLYHYFPDGKDDMARAVLARLAVQLRTALFIPLRTPGLPRQRINAMITTLDAFYRGGREACLLGSLAVGDSCRRFRPELTAVFAEWTDAIAAALRDHGVAPARARIRATDAVIRIEGALVLAAALGDIAPFTRTLRDLRHTLLAKAPVS